MGIIVRRDINNLIVIEMIVVGLSTNEMIARSFHRRV